MLVFPNCKVNLGLQVLQKRSDGYHDIATVFYPVPLKDVLEIVPPENTQQLTINNYGLPVNGDTADNLCVKAWHLLKKDAPDLPFVQIHLLKNIPMGAGLGGGSADGAFMLQLLNNKFHLELKGQQLIQYALQLGSDCPFFVVNKPCYATGRGELMETIDLDLSGYQLVMVNPGIHVNTGWAFERLNISGALTKNMVVKEVIMQPVSEWKYQLLNDFEQPVFKEYPEIKYIKENLYTLGAEYASMSGSGSIVFGLFNKDINLTSGLPAHYTVIQL
ncbi:MAG: 4-(cytidine 5'-diphospho)-2-C-methyl-D-erythritol kinase [Chitinophagaceae bacterium]